MYPVIKARNILGGKYSHLRDKEISQIIIFLEKLCIRVIDDVVSKGIKVNGEKQSGNF